MPKTTHAALLTPKQRQDVLRATSEVLGRGRNSGITPYQPGDVAAWLKITAATAMVDVITEEELPGRWVYTVDVFRSPLIDRPYDDNPTDEERRIATGATAYNSMEIGNTAETQGFFTPIVPEGEADCGDIIGIEPIPAGYWFQAQGRIRREGALGLTSLTTEQYVTLTDAQYLTLADGPHDYEWVYLFFAPNVPIIMLEEVGS